MEERIERACVICGQGFKALKNSSKQCCGPECAHVKGGQTRTVQAVSKREFTCQRCGISYQAKAINRGTYCSRECAWAAALEIRHKKAERPAQVKPPLRCDVCGCEFEGRANSHYCSDECRKEGNRRRYQLYAIAKKQVKPRDCKECGTTFTPEYGSKARTFCSVECGKRYGSAVGKANRRARMRAVPYEEINRRLVYERDEWICGICGKPVDRTLPAQHSWAKSLDHIIPLSRGGHHVESNVRLAHRVCNSVKCNQLDCELVGV